MAIPVNVARKYVLCFYSSQYNCPQCEAPLAVDKVSKPV